MFPFPMMLSMLIFFHSDLFTFLNCIDTSPQSWDLIIFATFPFLSYLMIFFYRACRVAQRDARASTLPVVKFQSSNLMVQWWVDSYSFFLCIVTIWFTFGRFSILVHIVTPNTTGQIWLGFWQLLYVYVSLTPQQVPHFIQIFQF